MMKPRLQSIIFILAFALLIQNTCPFGAAGKSSVAASCGSCPLHHGLVVASDGQKNIVSDVSPVHFPLYVFSVPKTTHAFRLDPVESVQPIIVDNYRNIALDELLRPPRA
jgi:hypothetical protein